MRHLVARRKLNRTTEHRRALRRNMAQSLFEHGQIRTTLTKAKDLRPFAERLITLARKAHEGSLAARQRLISLMGDRAIVPSEYQEQYEDMSDPARDRILRSRSGRRHRTGQARGGQPFAAVSVVHHLINEIAPLYADRPGGYTRVIRLGSVNKGDSAPRAILQLVGEEESPGTVTRPEKSARTRRADRRYAAAAKAGRRKARGKDERDAAADTPVATEEQPPVSEDQPDAESQSETAGGDVGEPKPAE
jgi:large subunit ribosomal protein L17